MEENKERVLSVQMKKVEDLVPYINNPRKNDESVSVVVRSISEFGFVNPIILDSKNVIIAGHTRLRAALQLGMTEVPTLIIDDLTDEQIKAFRIMDNKSAEMATWDRTLLKEELQSIANVEITGFSDLEYQEITNVIPDEPTDLEAPRTNDDIKIILSCKSPEDYEIIKPTLKQLTDLHQGVNYFVKGGEL